MEQFKHTWLAVRQAGWWSLNFCISARCLRDALRRQRFAQRRMGAASSVFATPRNLAHIS